MCEEENHLINRPRADMLFYKKGCPLGEWGLFMIAASVLQRWRQSYRPSDVIFEPALIKLYYYSHTEDIQLKFQLDHLKSKMHIHYGLINIFAILFSVLSFMEFLSVVSIPTGYKWSCSAHSQNSYHIQSNIEAIYWSCKIYNKVNNILFCKVIWLEQYLPLETNYLEDNKSNFSCIYIY